MLVCWYLNGCQLYCQFIPASTHQYLLNNLIRFLYRLSCLQISIPMVLHDIQDQLRPRNHRVYHHNVHVPGLKPHPHDQARDSDGLWHGVPILRPVLRRARQGLCRDLLRVDGFKNWCKWDSVPMSVSSVQTRRRSNVKCTDHTPR